MRTGTQWRVLISDQHQQATQQRADVERKPSWAGGDVAWATHGRMRPCPSGREVPRVYRSFRRPIRSTAIQKPSPTREGPPERFIGAEFSPHQSAHNLWPRTWPPGAPDAARSIRVPGKRPSSPRNWADNAPLHWRTQSPSGNRAFGTRPLTGPFGRPTNPMLGQNPAFARRPVTGPLGQRR